MWGEGVPVQGTLKELCTSHPTELKKNYLACLLKGVERK